MATANKKNSGTKKTGAKKTGSGSGRKKTANKAAEAARTAAQFRALGVGMMFLGLILALWFAVTWFGAFFGRENMGQVLVNCLAGPLNITAALWLVYCGYAMYSGRTGKYAGWQVAGWCFLVLALAALLHMPYFVGGVVPAMQAALSGFGGSLCGFVAGLIVCWLPKTAAYIALIAFVLLGVMLGTDMRIFGWMRSAAKNAGDTGARAMAEHKSRIAEQAAEAENAANSTEVSGASGVRRRFVTERQEEISLPPVITDYSGRRFEETPVSDYANVTVGDMMGEGGPDVLSTRGASARKSADSDSNTFDRPVIRTSGYGFVSAEPVERKTEIPENKSVDKAGNSDSNFDAKSKDVAEDRGDTPVLPGGVSAKTAVAADSCTDSCADMYSAIEADAGCREAEGDSGDAAVSDDNYNETKANEIKAENSAENDTEHDTEKNNVSSIAVKDGERVHTKLHRVVNYQLPPVSLMKGGITVRNSRIDQRIMDDSAALENVLASFGVKTKVVEVVCGPSIIRYELQPAPGVKISKIVSLADDIALALAARGLRIEAPVPGKSVVGIEIARDKTSPVYFKDVLSSENFQKSKSKISIALGVDINGNAIVGDLAEMPHLLIAGATGSGKSVCMNTLICSILYKALPEEVKFIMVDPKKVELTGYSGLPHLGKPVVTDPKKASQVLKEVVNEMERRYLVFVNAGVKNFKSYNELPNVNKMPQIVVLIDELADLMMVASHDVEDAICRLAQMARAAGIHLVIATQRPSVDVITGLIKANIPSRIAFAVSSQIDSRTILDMGGAEKLLGKGDMLYFPIGRQKPLRVQGAFLTEDEIQTLVDYCKKQAEPEYLELPVAVEEKPEEEEAEKNQLDELFIDACQQVLSSGQASASSLQRRFRIGYNRAARLIDTMQEMGIVSAPEGNKRTILMTMETFAATYLHDNTGNTDNTDNTDNTSGVGDGADSVGDKNSVNRNSVNEKSNILEESVDMD